MESSRSWRIISVRFVLVMKNCAFPALTFSTIARALDGTMIDSFDCYDMPLYITYWTLTARHITTGMRSSFSSHHSTFSFSIAELEWPINVRNGSTSTIASNLCAPSTNRLSRIYIVHKPKIRSYCSGPASKHTIRNFHSTMFSSVAVRSMQSISIDFR